MEKYKFDIASSVASCIGNVLSADETASFLETPSDVKNGDVSFPCFKLAKTLRKSPVAIAADIASKITLPDYVEKVDAVSGYLNFYLKPSYYAGLLENITDDSVIRSSGKGKTVCLDFSSPNIAKRFHLGHIGTTIIGNALRNTFKYCGWNVVAINHLGDWGTSFGKLLCAYKMWSSRELVEERGVGELERIYARFNKEAQENDSLNQDARDAFCALENGNEEYREIWSYFREISLREYMKTYKLLGIDFDSYTGESFFTDKMPAIVEELKEKNMLKLDDGASIIDLSEYNMPPCLILKRDGSTLYPARDIAAAKWRKQEYDFDKCVYVTSAGQSLHFAQWFKVVELMGYDWADGLVHVPYGTMSFGGEKLASRTGNIIYLDDLLAQAIEKAEKIIEEKNADLPNKHETAVAIGVGAIVFNALFNARIKDVDFSWDTALTFEGSTGPYLQYTYARACSVLRKCAAAGSYEGYLPNDDEKNLIKQLSLFSEKVSQSLEQYEPSVITRYLLETSGLFNQFYHSSPVVKAEGAEKNFRITLTSAFRDIAGKCLELLGMRKTEEI